MLTSPLNLTSVNIMRYLLYSINTFHFYKPILNIYIILKPYMICQSPLDFLMKLLKAVVVTWQGCTNTHIHHFTLAHFCHSLSYQIFCMPQTLHFCVLSKLLRRLLDCGHCTLRLIHKSCIPTPASPTPTSVIVSSGSGMVTAISLC